MAKIDTYQQVTDRIVAALEEGTRPWHKQWVNGGAVMDPRRSNGERYRGINVLLLWMSAAERGFSGRSWFTFKQALDLGANVRKGEKGTQIVFFKKLDIKEQNDAGEDVSRSVPMLKTYTVFNADQIENLPDRFRTAPVQIVGGKDRDEACEAALRSSGADIRETDHAQAYYAPGADFVNMPRFELFTSTSGFLATLAHELCHWTGHTSRLDRAQLNEFGSKDYAFEELVAEIGAAMVGARLGIFGEHIDNHAAYVESWLKALRNDKRMIFKAATMAQAAADLVLVNAGELEAFEIEEEPETIEQPEQLALFA
ncbi:MAG: zincin-like metallopeptidase domain-containing protein [Pseudomonadota bacterium]|nr:zincin-like metallopeptidase domain-containing protein [Pseudomonadota bacterium]